METQRIADLLEGNSYPGRGIILGRSSDGEHAVIAYFIMGRSENSRNRIFVQQDEGIRTQAFDPAKLTDPSLIIYNPVRVCNGKTIVTNGDQTDTICNFIARGKSFEDALRTRAFEPDAPNFTPRISGMVEGTGYKLSILKSANGNAAGAQRYFFEYENPSAGLGHFIHTYKCDGNPIPSFEGEPIPIEITGAIGSFTDMLWNSLNAGNKVSLFTRFIHVKTGAVQTRILNKNQ
ncbi:IMP cyclohydrolase [Hydrogenoanaerobacterium sp.]|uniref:IMP cyclohydrolase n=1 Tax=Hydrogenoanaerobacterium sp. TaxID=2953763 RepID=UPI0028A02155|nr:IMP cyclohydrolase [Hydrogenoanaerobacterium sp.]